jgi:putative transposase
MRQLNGVFTQKSNWRHGRVGHVFQGRYKADLVQKKCYLLELVRYVVHESYSCWDGVDLLDWKWSSY